MREDEDASRLGLVQSSGPVIVIPLPANLTPFPPVDLSFGVGGIEFFSPESLEEEQAGYRGPGWNDAWLVVAREGACADPVFVDRSHPDLAVLTAVHGAGSWRASPLAATWRQFVAAVELARPYTVGREHPVGLEKNPPSPEEQQALRDRLQGILGATTPQFWALFLELPEP